MCGSGACSLSQRVRARLRMSLQMGHAVARAPDCPSRGTSRHASGSQEGTHEHVARRPPRASHTTSKHSRSRRYMLRADGPGSGTSNRTRPTSSAPARARCATKGACIRSPTATTFAMSRTTPARMTSIAWMSSSGLECRRLAAAELFGFAVAQTDFAYPVQRPGRGWVWGFSLSAGF